MFRRSSVTGRADLLVGDEVVALQNPYRVSTHFAFKTERRWNVSVSGRDIEVVKGRPIFLAGIRKNSFAVLVDGQLVAEATGR